MSARARGLAAAAAVLLAADPAHAQQPLGAPAPVIETHLHAGAIRSSEHRDSVLERLDRLGATVALVSVHDTAATAWHAVAPRRIWLGPAFPCYGGRYPGGGDCFASSDGWPDIDWLREQYESGRMRVMGEMFYVYYGIAPTDPRLDPYWALAAELDIPVGVHTGRRPVENLPAGCCPEYDDDLGDPSLLAPVLERYPGLRVWLMHAPGAAEWIDETIALMQAYPNVYAEMSIVNSIAPPPAHAGALGALLDAGLGDRIMFGSDNMPVDPILQRMQLVPFLSDGQRTAILCDNAARFLRLDPDTCASPR